MSAWLSATPGGGQSNRQLYPGVAEPRLPEGFEHMLAWLIEAGTIRRQIGFSGVFLDALGFAEIQAWANGTGKVLTPFEFQTLNEMSVMYAHQANQKDGGLCPDQSVQTQNTINEARLAGWIAIAKKAD